jgi:hypothetical protein
LSHPGIPIPLNKDILIKVTEIASFLNISESNLVVIITTKFDSEIFRNEAISVTFIKISLLSGIGIPGCDNGLRQ